MNDPANQVAEVIEPLVYGTHREHVHEIAARIVQTVLQAINYSSCVVCPTCGAEVDVRDAEKL